jgi:hypothetical protein
MPDYTQNMQNAISGHTDPAPHKIKSQSNADDDADVRDMLSILVGAGKGGLKPDDQAAVISRLQTILGKDKANKLINHAAIFNERTDVKAKTAQQRISQFYDMGSRDPDVNTLINKTKQLAQGPIAGTKQSVESLMQNIDAGKTLKPAIDSTNNNISQVQNAKSSGF